MSDSEEREDRKPPAASLELNAPKGTKRTRLPADFRRKKPSDMPKRPLSAYNLFFRDQRAKILEERAAGSLECAGTEKDQKGLGLFATLGKIISQRWKDVSPDEMKKYKAEADADSRRYKAEMEEYSRAAAAQRTVEARKNRAEKAKQRRQERKRQKMTEKQRKEVDAKESEEEEEDPVATVRSKEPMSIARITSDFQAANPSAGPSLHTFSGAQATVAQPLIRESFASQVQQPFLQASAAGGFPAYERVVYDPQVAAALGHGSSYPPAHQHPPYSLVAQRALSEYQQARQLGLPEYGYLASSTANPHVQLSQDPAGCLPAYYQLVPTMGQPTNTSIASGMAMPVVAQSHFSVGQELGDSSDSLNQSLLLRLLMLQQQQDEDPSRR